MKYFFLLDPGRYPEPRSKGILLYLIYDLLYYSDM